MANFNGIKRSLTLQVVKLENGETVSVTQYDGREEFTYNEVTYPTITNADLIVMSDENYAARLLAFESYVGSIEGMDVEANIEEYFEPILNDAGLCPLPSNYFPINVVSNNESLGTVEGDGAYLQGTICTIVATALPGAIFEHWEWTLNGVEQEAIEESEYSFAVSASAEFTAVFVTTIVTTFVVSFSNHVCQVV